PLLFPWLAELQPFIWHREIGDFLLISRNEWIRPGYVFQGNRIVGLRSMFLRELIQRLDIHECFDAPHPGGLAINLYYLGKLANSKVAIDLLMSLSISSHGRRRWPFFRHTVTYTPRLPSATCGPLLEARCPPAHGVVAPHQHCRHREQQP